MKIVPPKDKSFPVPLFLLIPLLGIAGLLAAAYFLGRSHGKSQITSPPFDALPRQDVTSPSSDNQPRQESQFNTMDNLICTATHSAAYSELTYQVRTYESEIPLSEWNSKAGRISVWEDKGSSDEKLLVDASLHSGDETGYGANNFATSDVSVILEPDYASGLLIGITADNQIKIADLRHGETEPIEVSSTCSVVSQNNLGATSSN